MNRDEIADGIEAMTNQWSTMCDKLIDVIDGLTTKLALTRDDLSRLRVDYTGATRTVEHLDAELTRLRTAVEGIAEEYADAADMGYVGARHIVTKLRSVLEG